MDSPNRRGMDEAFDDSSRRGSSPTGEHLGIERQQAIGRRVPGKPPLDQRTARAAHGDQPGPVGERRAQRTGQRRLVARRDQPAGDAGEDLVGNAPPPRSRPRRAGAPSLRGSPANCPRRASDARRASPPRTRRGASRPRPARPGGLASPGPSAVPAAAGPPAAGRHRPLPGATATVPARVTVARAPRPAPRTPCSLPDGRPPAAGCRRRLRRCSAAARAPPSSAASRNGRGRPRWG